MSNFFVVCLYLACDSFGVIWQPTTGNVRVSSRLIASAAESSLEAMIREKSRNKIKKEC